MNLSSKNMFFILFIALIFGAVLFFGYWMFYWQYNKADAILSKWAEQNSFQVLEKQDANPVGTGPKAYRGSNKQVIYRITVLDKEGRKRSGLVKIGGENIGTLADNITVDWDN